MKKDLKILKKDLNLRLGKEDCKYSLADADAPTVISAKLGSGLVQRILVANSNIMIRNAFDALGFKDGDLKTHQPKGKHPEKRLWPSSSTYNVILGRKTINNLSGVIYTKFFVMKYETDTGTFETLHGIERQPKPAENKDLLDFTPAGMLCKDPSVVSHSLAVDPNHRPMAQGKETDFRQKGPRGEETNQGALRSRIH
ncbi:hypothetical protein PIB30_046321 [Stylosanthes scabra]|uniref:Uncharacterized protein n=1 Tax=Stylosanthes scabra TaxID=79078 RepID=A0ABU6TIK4_9FABA|nr:hypothetical protein [Stylosanthes scabra]